MAPVFLLDDSAAHNSHLMLKFSTGKSVLESEAGVVMRLAHLIFMWEMRSLHHLKRMQLRPFSYSNDVTMQANQAFDSLFFSIFYVFNGDNSHQSCRPQRCRRQPFLVRKNSVVTS